jgi:hypothetical protein
VGAARGVRAVVVERAVRLDLVRDGAGPGGPVPLAGRRRLPRGGPAGRRRPDQPAVRRPEPRRTGAPGARRADDRGLAAAGELGPGARHAVPRRRRQRLLAGDQPRLPDRRRRGGHDRAVHAGAHGSAAARSGSRCRCSVVGWRRSRSPTAASSTSPPAGRIPPGR